MFEPVTKNIYRWSLTDPEFGEEMVGHLLMKGDSLVLIDPPATPKIFDSVKVLGKPEAVIMTTYSHKRGCAHLSRVFGIPLLIPETTGTGHERSEDTLMMFGLSSGVKYGEHTELPLGIKAHHLLAEFPLGKVALEEMSLQFGDFLIVGDAAWGQNGKLNIFPTGIMPDEGGKKASAIGSALKAIIRKTGSKGLLSGHGDDIKSGLEKLI